NHDQPGAHDGQQRLELGGQAGPRRGIVGRDGAERAADGARVRVDVRVIAGGGTSDGGHCEHPFHVTRSDGNRGTRTCPPRTGQARSTSENVRRGGVCPGQNETAARRADFGPDYQSPSLASLPSRRTAAPGHTARGLCRPRAPNRVTPEETTVREEEIPGRTSLVRALALHGVLRPPGSKPESGCQPLGLTP